MNLNGRAVSFAAVISFLQTIATVYFATNPHPSNWLDLFRIEFVMTWIISLGGVTTAAHINFRNPNQRTRFSDSTEISQTDIRDLLKKGKKD